MRTLLKHLLLDHHVAHVLMLIFLLVRTHQVEHMMHIPMGLPHLMLNALMFKPAMDFSNHFVIPLLLNNTVVVRLCVW